MYNSNKCFIFGEIKAMEYTAEDYINFIIQGRRDKISPKALAIIATRFKKLQDEIELLKYFLERMKYESNNQ